MKNLLTVLKKLGKKMTGEDIIGKNLVTVVDDIAEKYTGGGGGGGGDGITVVETTATYNETATTFTNAAALFDMFEDIVANPEKVFKYKMLVFDDLLPKSCHLKSMEDGLWSEFGRNSEAFRYDPVSQILYYNLMGKSRSDITPDDTIVFSDGGGGGGLS